MKEPAPLSDKSHVKSKDGFGAGGFSANLEEVDVRKNQRTGSAAAFVLAAIVLFVFFVLRDYGPESAIRKFHMGVLHQNGAEVQAVTEQPLDSPDAQMLIQRVMAMSAAGATYQVARMDRRSRDVRAAVVYTYPNGIRDPMIWVVEKRGASWKVDASRTLTVIRDAMGF